MNYKAQKIANFYNANKNLYNKENTRIKTLQKVKPKEHIFMNLANSEFDKDAFQIYDVFDINDVYKRNIKCICNVYQEKYKNNINATGFGDFIRGSYFLLDFCDKFHIKLEFLINHPINMFLKNNFGKNITFLNIPFFVKNNWHNYYIDKQNNIYSIPGKLITSAFISYLKDDVFVIGDKAYIYTIAYPMNNIQEKHKFIMQKLLEPNDEMKLYINDTMKRYNLVKKEYVVLHVRSGDSYLTAEKKELRNDYIQKLLYEIVNSIRSLREKTNYVIISDNNYVKEIINKSFPTLISFFHKITHFGEGMELEREKVKNTMLDFYIMSCSKQIFSFSCYKHGTGFSQWCAETYNIPYLCKFVSS